MTKGGEDGTMRGMRSILVLMLLVMSWFIAPVMAEDDAPSAAELREARKEAKAYIKKEIARNKKLVGYLKKIKDDKSAKKQSLAILKYLDNNVGEKTALGEVGEAKRPEGQAMDEEMAKKQKEIEASYDKINLELERIGELELGECTEFDQMVQKVSELLP